MNGREQAGIYVEILIRAPLERVWLLTQTPAVHRRWDLRFSEIEYLPKTREDDPQRFLYETRIGGGLAIRGTGESVATRVAADGTAVSSLKFASDDRLSLIREGAGYWRYIPVEEGVRFLTWYDYRVRFGAAGRFLDGVFRPLMGWATAWSFDRMRLWAERELVPEATMRQALLHAIARMALATVWLWHGVVPKLLFRDADERAMLLQSSVPLQWLPGIGAAEIAMAVLLLVTWRWRGMFVLQGVLMVATLADVATQSPAYLWHAFNPVTLNLLMLATSVVGWIAFADQPSARRCLRSDPRLADTEKGR